MRGTSCAEAESFETPSLLPPDAQRLLDEATGIFSNRSWWDVVLAHGVPRGARTCFLGFRSAGRIVALVPMLRMGKRMGSLTTPYTCEYHPLFSVGLSGAARVDCMAVFAHLCRPFGSVRLDAIPIEWDGFRDLEAGARRAGLAVLRFDHFGNWYEDVGGLDFHAYLLGRPGALRETIRRRLRRADGLPGAGFQVISEPERMNWACETFEAVYRQSWKEPEPFPSFNTALMRAMAASGILRFGVWSIGPDPVAVQLWAVKGAHATVLKLAHDERFKALSPGTVLTALMLRYLLDQEQVARIDFGRGDDPYKQAWASQRRQRIGLLLINPWHPLGAAALVRHRLGQIRSGLGLTR